jgi:hypothetical protein
MVADLAEEILLNGFSKDKFYSELQLDYKNDAFTLIKGYFDIYYISGDMDQINILTTQYEMLLARCATISELEKNNLFNLLSVARHSAHLWSSLNPK